MFKFAITKQSKTSSLRTGVIETAHGIIKTPVFMPVGTVGAVKTAAPWELRELGVEIILGNTYHLYLRPGEKLIKDFGGLAEFNHWRGPILTDSGGFQVFSLGAGKKRQNSVVPDLIRNPLIVDSRLRGNDNSSESLVKISDNGVEFKSHLDGSKHFFTPEKVVDIQLAIGSDIIMPLDVCPPSKASRSEIEKAVELSIKWLKRSKIHLELRIKNHELGMKNHNSELSIHNSPALFGIIQGGTHPDFREYCAREMIKLDLPGYSIGGLAVGESQAEMLEVIKLLDGILPKDKPRYLMGVGTPDDIYKATQLGVDMFDCVLPTRMARHGTAYAEVKSQKSRRAEPLGGAKVKSAMSFEEINLLKAENRADKNSIDNNCQCPTCKEKFSRAYLHHLVKEKEILGIRLLTLHNLWVYLKLMKKIQNSAE